MYRFVLAALCAVVCCGAVGAVGPSDVRGPDSTEFTPTASALIMGGTGQVFSIGPSTTEFLAEYVAAAYRDVIRPSGLCAGGDPGCDLIAVYTPEELRPLTGLADLPFDASVAAGLENLDDCVRGEACVVTEAPYTVTGSQRISDAALVLFGRSQSAVIASEQKRQLIADPVDGTAVRFTLLSNPARPNGGVLERFAGLYIPFLGISFNGSTPTNSPRSSPLTTVDLAHQYDAWVDFPTNPLNILAVLNAALGSLHLHYGPLFLDSAILQGQYRDTTYYLQPTPLLPLLVPIARIPLIGMPLALALDPPLRVLIETGYDRTINPGTPTPARYLYFPNPITTVANLIEAIPIGWDNAIAHVSGDPDHRPFGTVVPGPYGVGGPPVYAGAVDPYGPPPVAEPIAAEDPAGPFAASAAGSAGPTYTGLVTARPSESVGSARVRAAAASSGDANASRPERPAGTLAVRESAHGRDRSPAGPDGRPSRPTQRAGAAPPAYPRERHPSGAVATVEVAEACCD